MKIGGHKVIPRNLVLKQFDDHQVQMKEEEKRPNGHQVSK
jgi:hypothetical protein